MRRDAVIERLEQMLLFFRIAFMDCNDYSDNNLCSWGERGTCAKGATAVPSSSSLHMLHRYVAQQLHPQIRYVHPIDTTTSRDSFRCTHGFCNVSLHAIGA